MSDMSDTLPDSAAAAPPARGVRLTAEVTARIAARIAQELSCRPEQVVATVDLLDGGATVPFVARYRKEVTGGLDDTQLRTLEERLTYLRELEERRIAIARSIDEQGKLDPDLAGRLLAAETKAELEDLYLPFKKKRRTKAQIAREAGLEPLADLLLADPSRDPATEAERFVDADKAVADGKAALDGARQILMERFAENAALVGRLRDHLSRNGVLRARVVEGQEAAGAKFSDYFDYREALKDVPSHRALALLRGRNEGILALELVVDEDDPAPVKPVERMVMQAAGIEDRGRPADRWLAETARWAWRVKLSLHLEVDLMNGLRERAEDEAIRVFARNLKDLLLAAPAGHKAVLGLDPGIRTGVKVAVVDPTGKLLETATVYPFPPRNDVAGTRAALLALIARHKVALIAIGNGTASRETDRLVLDLLGDIPVAARPVKVVVNEAGASIYSASALAAREFPDVDVSLRGAISIARRLQDPLAELVKIDPKSIGVGQYQHDVNQTKLARALDAVVEDAVNAVGVDLNTASAPLLSRVSGLTAGLAEAIVAQRDMAGPFRTRKDLLGVPRLGPKAFEQCAGFLRVPGGANPLDASAVHPEAYPLAERIVKACGRPLAEVMGNGGLLRSLDPQRFADDTFGVPTVRDILSELEKPGRDPRPEFKTARLADGVETMADLRPGMMLEGTVTNVTNFGAFVDIGVHQDGLVHVSQIADRFVRDPAEVVKAGDIVRVRVVEVDMARKRIALSMRKDAEGRPGPRGDGPRDDGPRGGGPRGGGPRGGGPRGEPRGKGPGAGEAAGAMAAALAAALNRKGR